MKIAVIGCGAMGSIYAARLAAAGNDVLAIDSYQPGIEQIARHGLRVTGPGYDQTVPLRAATTAPPETMDLIVLAVKAADVTTGCATSASDAGPEHTGTDHPERSGLGGDRRRHRRRPSGSRSGSQAGSARRRVAPGHVHHNAMRAMRFGAYSSLPATPRSSRSRGLGPQAGFDAAAVTDIAAMQWEKLICNAAYSAPCALTGMTVGQVMDDPEMGPVSRAAATEAWTVARASGIAIAVTDPVDHVRAFGAGMPDAKPSALLDHEARRVSEIDVINGAVPRQGARVGVEAPVNATLTALVKAIERGWG